MRSADSAYGINAHRTASPQPVVITIQPDFSAFDLCSNTPATTPSPSRISNIVPTSSAPKSLLDSPRNKVAVKRNSIVIPEKKRPLVRGGFLERVTGRRRRKRRGGRARA